MRCETSLSLGLRGLLSLLSSPRFSIGSQGLSQALPCRLGTLPALTGDLEPVTKIMNTARAAAYRPDNAVVHHRRATTGQHAVSLRTECEFFSPIFQRLSVFPGQSDDVYSADRDSPHPRDRDCQPSIL